MDVQHAKEPGITPNYIYADSYRTLKGYKLVLFKTDTPIAVLKTFVAGGSVRTIGRWKITYKFKYDDK